MPFINTDIDVPDMVGRNLTRRVLVLDIVVGCLVALIVLCYVQATVYPFTETLTISPVAAFGGAFLGLVAMASVAWLHTRSASNLATAMLIPETEANYNMTTDRFTQYRSPMIQILAIPSFLIIGGYGGVRLHDEAAFLGAHVVESAVSLSVVQKTATDRDDTAPTGTKYLSGTLDGQEIYIPCRFSTCNGIDMVTLRVQTGRWGTTRIVIPHGSSLQESGGPSL